MKKQILFALAVVCVIAVACGGGEKKSETPVKKAAVAAKTETPKAKEETAAKPAGNRKGALIFKQYCVACHGADGKLGLSGAKDLSISTISMEERIDQVTNGKGFMTPFKSILSEDQIIAVTDYLDELK